MELRAENIAKWYHRKTGEANRFFAVKETTLTVSSGTLTVLTGRSGSGKKTLLHMLGGLLQPDQGTIWLDDTDLYSMEDARLSRFRNSHFGIIPQGYTAVRPLTVFENILLPVRMYGSGRDPIPKSGHVQTDISTNTRADKVRLAEKEADRLLERFGILHLKEEYPDKLSGGEQRRLAVARALAGQPPVILADEPTGDLDDENTAFVMEELRQAADKGAVVFVVTHESDAAAYADHVWRMNAGQLEGNVN